MAYPDVEGDIAAALATAGVGTVGSSIFTGPLRPAGGGIPVAAVFVLQAGGVNSPYLNGGVQSWREPRVQVSIRSARDDYDAGIATARAVLTALHAKAITGYTLCQADDPIYVRRDGEDCHVWAVNARLGLKA